MNEKRLIEQANEILDLGWESSVIKHAGWEVTMRARIPDTGIELTINARESEYHGIVAQGDIAGLAAAGFHHPTEGFGGPDAVTNVAKTFVEEIKESLTSKIERFQDWLVKIERMEK